MRAGRSAMLFSAAALLAVTAGCSAASSSSTGSGGSTAGSTATAASTSQAGGASSAAAPGHDTPQAAVAGMIQDEFAGNWTQMCTYLAPSQRSLCSSLKSSTIPTGKITVDGAVISGDLALVKVTGKACFSGNGCQTNSNPSLGLPTGSETFKQAYDKQLQSNAFSPVPCIKVNGKWYVNAATQ